MLRCLRMLWCERNGHRFREVGRVYSGAEGRAREVVVETCGVCGAQRDRPSETQESPKGAVLKEQERLEFLARARRRALRRAARRRG